MSFLKKLFGGGGSSGGPKVLGQEEYNGYTIKAVEMRSGAEFQLCGAIEKEFNGEMKSYSFIRADKLPSVDQATSTALSKGRQIVDEQGDQLFR